MGIRLRSIEIKAVLCAAVLALGPVRSHCETAEPLGDDILQPQISANAISGSAGSLAAWGDNAYGQLNGTPAGSDFVAIRGGTMHSLALKSDGSVVGWGDNSSGQANAPIGNNYTAVAAGYVHSLALKSDGSVVGWGDNSYGQANAPIGNNYTAVAAGYVHSLALKSDGSLAGWGLNASGQINVPAGNNYVAIAGGSDHSLALKSDGSIVGWGWNGYGQTDCPAGNNYVAIAAGGYHSLALKSDGSIVGWGRNHFGQTSCPMGNSHVAIAAGAVHSLALKSDGSLVGWGWNDYGQTNCPAGNKYVALAAGYIHSLALAGHTVHAGVSGGHGTVSPTVQPVGVGGSAKVTIWPDDGYRVAAILDNTVSMTVALSYVVSNAHEDHTIVVTFEPGCDPPSITTDPKSQTVASGQSTTLTVVGGGTMALHYQWYQGTYPDTSHPVGSDSDSCSTGALTTATSFWVRVSNECGQADSAAATITVTGGGSGPTITRITSKTGKPGSSAVIYGSGFSTDKKKDVVQFGTKKVRKISKAKSTSLKITIPKIAKGTYAVTVVVNNVASNSVNFTVK